MNESPNIATVSPAPSSDVATLRSELDTLSARISAARERTLQTPPAPFTAPVPEPATPKTLVTLASLRPGYQTTEFWISLIFGLFNALIAANIIPTNSPAVQAIASLGLAATGAGYANSRGKSKGLSLLTRHLPLLLIALAIPLLAGCATGVPDNKITLESQWGSISIDSPKNVIMENPKIQFSTNGMVSFTADKFFSTNAADIIYQGSAGQASIVHEYMTGMTNIFGQALEQAAKGAVSGLK